MPQLAIFQPLGVHQCAVVDRLHLGELQQAWLRRSVLLATPAACAASSRRRLLGRTCASSQVARSNDSTRTSTESELARATFPPSRLASTTGYGVVTARSPRELKLGAMFGRAIRAALNRDIKLRCESMSFLYELHDL